VHRALRRKTFALAVFACAFAASPAAAQYWGAVAIDHKSGDYGYAFQHPNENSARSRAIRECRSHSRQHVCDQIYAFRDSCVALIENNRNPEDARYLGAGETEQKAILDAMNKCRTDPQPQNCEHSISYCSWSNRVTSE
jgi:hypothetical protein